ncbi:MAG: hypothetical protein ABH877_00645 [bacterium]
MKTKTIQIRGVPQATLDAVVAWAKARVRAQTKLRVRVTQETALLMALEEVAAMEGANED